MFFDITYFLDIQGPEGFEGGSGDVGDQGHAGRFGPPGDKVSVHVGVCFVVFMSGYTPLTPYGYTPLHPVFSVDVFREIKGIINMVLIQKLK